MADKQTKLISTNLHEHKTKGAMASVVALDVPLADVESYGIVVTEVAMPGHEVKPGVWVGLNTSIPWDQVVDRGAGVHRL